MSENTTTLRKLTGQDTIQDTFSHQVAELSAFIAG